MEVKVWRIVDNDWKIGNGKCEIKYLGNKESLRVSI